MSRKRKSTSALEGDEGEEEESLGRKLLRWMESKEDVSFLAGPEGKQEEIKASSILLSALSPVFDVMFNENWKQQDQKVIELPDIKPHIFRHFIKLMLIDKVSVEDFKEPELSDEDVLHMLYVAKKYGAKSILSICRVWIYDSMTVQNVLPIFFTLQTVDETKLEQEAFEFIKKNIQALMEEESFLDLSEENLMEILHDDDLSASELTLFQGVYRWAESKCASSNVEINGENIRAALGSVLFLLRFPVMTNRDFFKSVEPTGILSLEEINEIARCIALKWDSSFVSKLGFSSKGRGKNWSVNESFIATVPQPVFESCLVFNPPEDMTLNRVVVNAMDSGSIFHNASHTWSFKLRIFNGDGEILPMITKSSSCAGGLSYFFPNSLILKRGRNYNINYEVKRAGPTPFYFLQVSDFMITITVEPTVNYKYLFRPNIFD